MTTTTPAARLSPVEDLVEPADVEIVVPVHDEEADLERSVRRLHAYLTCRFPLSWTITIADNASRDGTWAIASRLASTLDRVRAVHLDEKGRGRALRATWTASDARVVAYMDVDLSTVLVLPAPHRFSPVIVVLVLGVIGMNRRATLYDTLVVPGVLDELPAVCGRIAVGWAAVVAVSPLRSLPPAVLVAAITVHCLAACAGREAVHARRRRALRRRPCPALVVGPLAVARLVSAALLRQPGCGVRPVGLLADDLDVLGDADDEAGLPVLTTAQDARRAVIQNGVETVLVVGAATRTENAAVLRGLAAYGCVLWELDADPPSYGLGGRSRRAGHLAGFPRRLLGPQGGQRRGTAGKRVLDVVFSGLLLVLAGPVLLVCAAVLRIMDGPGVVFRQERIGKDGRPFTMLKLRTHRPASAHEAATRWSVANEQDMSPFCHFLRRTSLDELLQLWNVFRGDMSLVGPRPERPYFVAKFSQAHPGYPARHRMRTGITGLAQIHGLRGDTSIEDRCRYDNAYIDNWSLWQDICILLRTVTQFVRPTGS